MNHHPSLSLDKRTRDVSVIMKYQQDQMILRALRYCINPSFNACCKIFKVCLVILGHYVATLRIKGLKIVNNFFEIDIFSIHVELIMLKIFPGK